MIQFALEHLTLKDYARLTNLEQTVIDVRAPIEFARGSLPNAINAPILYDDDRHVVGTCFKMRGQAAAVELGLKRVSGTVKAQRIASWLSIINNHPNAVLMCYRGGLRSKIAQQWLYEANALKIPRVDGGFKALRAFLSQSLSVQALNLDFYLLAGYTGAGKTQLLRHIPFAIDLEGLAHHRGSSFGGYIDLQPSQIDFEHALAYDIIDLKHGAWPHIVVELEGKHIGRTHLPQGLIDKMQRGKIVNLIASLETRTDITWREYVVNELIAYRQTYGELGQQKWADKILNSIERLQKRLGHTRNQQVKALFNDAQNSTDLSAHKQWIYYLLQHYYDPMYNYQKQKWVQPIVYEGDADAVIAYLQHL